MYVRYADDWIVAVNGSLKEAQEILSKIRRFCKEELSLTVSEEKTKITNSYKNKALFLGTNIRHALKYSFYKTKEGIRKRVVRGLIFSAPMDRIKKKFTEAGYLANNRGKTRVK